MEAFDVDKTRILGTGEYGVVYAGTEKSTGVTVAYKRSRKTPDLFMQREASVLQRLKHPNIIRLLCSDVGVLVFEYASTDLEQRIFQTSDALPIAQHMQQLLRGLAFMHQKGVVHRVSRACACLGRCRWRVSHPRPRPLPLLGVACPSPAQDLKPGNLLLTAAGQLKIADFGLARPVRAAAEERPAKRARPGPMSPHVVTLWYRPPEVLWGSTEYGCEVDMWSAGCVCAEMHLRARLFQGVSDIDQLGKIFHALGTPTEGSWPGHREMPCFVEWTECEGTPWGTILAGAQAEPEPRWRTLIERALVLCPARRITASEASEPGQ